MGTPSSLRAQCRDLVTILPSSSKGKTNKQQQPSTIPDGQTEREREKTVCARDVRVCTVTTTNLLLDPFSTTSEIFLL
eukprot:m.165562 g.165562  ORF g.165562 m.165562 type:complete len:78 (-) comp12578_c0_seq1:26-259(-)